MATASDALQNVIAQLIWVYDEFCSLCWSLLKTRFTNGGIRRIEHIRMRRVAAVGGKFNQLLILPTQPCSYSGNATTISPTLPSFVSLFGRRSICPIHRHAVSTTCFGECSRANTSVIQEVRVNGSIEFVSRNQRSGKCNPLSQGRLLGCSVERLCAKLPRIHQFCLQWREYPTGIRFRDHQVK